MGKNILKSCLINMWCDIAVLCHFHQTPNIIVDHTWTGGHRVNVEVEHTPLHSGLGLLGFGCVFMYSP